MIILCQCRKFCMGVGGKESWKQRQRELSVAQCKRTLQYGEKIPDTMNHDSVSCAQTKNLSNKSEWKKSQFKELHRLVL